VLGRKSSTARGSATLWKSTLKGSSRSIVDNVSGPYALTEQTCWCLAPKEYRMQITIAEQNREPNSQPVSTELKGKVLEAFSRNLTERDIMLEKNRKIGEQFASNNELLLPIIDKLLELLSDEVITLYDDCNEVHMESHNSPDEIGGRDFIAKLSGMARALTTCTDALTHQRHMLLPATK
jgi:hypothetical protein